MMLNRLIGKSVMMAMVLEGPLVPTVRGAALMTGRVANEPSPGLSRFGGVKI